MPLPDFLRRMRVHRLMLYYLLALLAVAMALCIAGLLPYAARDLAFSALLITAATWSGNWLFARAWGAKSDMESILITALILTLIITPMAFTDASAIGYAIFASLWAAASKFLLTLGRRPLFNPAAFGVALAAVAFGASVSWWIGGSLYLLPIILLGGVMIMAKMRNFNMLAAFAIASLAVIAWTSHTPLQAAAGFTIHSMFLFFVFVMLTEPRTAPNGRTNRMLYGALVGLLFAPAIHIGPIYSTPELALLIGNVFAGATFVWQRRGLATA